MRAVGRAGRTTRGRAVTRTRGIRQASNHHLDPTAVPEAPAHHVALWLRPHLPPRQRGSGWRRRRMKWHGAGAAIAMGFRVMDTAVNRPRVATKRSNVGGTTNGQNGACQRVASLVNKSTKVSGSGALRRASLTARSVRPLPLPRPLPLLLVVRPPLHTPFPFLLLVGVGAYAKLAGQAKSEAPTPQPAVVSKVGGVAKTGQAENSTPPTLSLRRDVNA